MPLVLGVRSSLHHTVAEVRDADSGSLVSTGTSEHPLARGDEHDPATWWNGLVRAVAATGERNVAAMSVAGELGGLLALDGSGSVLHPALTWASQVAAGDAAELVRRLGAGRWAKATGMVPTAGSTVAQLAWLRRSRQAVFARLGSVLPAHAWLTFRLTGRLVTDRGMASSTGFWSTTDQRWMLAALAIVDDRVGPDEWLERLPHLASPASRADWLAAPTYELLGLRGRPLVAAGTGIPMAQSLALGLSRRTGRVGIVVGRTAAVMTATRAPMADESGTVRSLAAADDAHLALVRAATGTGPLHSLAALRGVDVLELARAAADAPGGGHDVLVAASAVRGATTIAGLDGVPDLPALGRAALEGMACEVLDAVDALRATGAPLVDEPPIVCAAEGAAEAVAATVAEVAQAPVALLRHEGDLAATGAAVQAAAVLTERTPAAVAEAWATDDAVEWEPRQVVDGPSLRRQHRALREALRAAAPD